MPTDRSTILTEALRVNPSDVRWYFISDYYDGPISGLAFFRDCLHRVCCFREDVPNQHIYVLHELTAEELAEDLRIKVKFETLVGTHWSFDSEGKRLPHALRPEESRQRFYDEEKPRSKFDARDRPAVAWFDVASASSQSPAN